MTLDTAVLADLAAKATPGPWRWQGEDYRGGWGWQLLVGPNGEGLIVGQGLDGGPSEHLRGFVPVDPALCVTGMVSEGKPHVEPVHVLEADAAYIAAFSPDVAAALLAEVESLRKALRDVLPIATDGAAMAHLNRSGIMQNPPHDGTFKECLAPWCVRNRERIDKARAALAFEEGAAE